MRQAMLTTNDNPFDPFDDFASWYNFDMLKGYSTCCYLARLAFTSDSLSDIENSKAIEQAIDDIILYDPTGIYVKVVRDIDEPTYTEGEPGKLTKDFLNVA